MSHLNYTLKILFPLLGLIQNNLGNLIYDYSLGLEDNGS